jgi:hypothetical protein
VEESESDEELEAEELEEDLAFLALLALGASLSELESEEDSLLDSALRFTPVGFFTTGAGAFSSSSSSSSASLSELDEEEEEEEGEEAREGFSSCISTSESLSLELSLSELSLEVEDSFLSAFLSQDWNNSSRDGAFCASAAFPAFFRSLAKAALALEKPLSERKVATDERS